MNRRFRLRKASDFERVRRSGKSYAHPLLVLISLPNQSSTTQVGVAAGRSVGGAVQRNRAKRLLREAARELHPQIAAGHDLVLIARRPIGEVKSQQVRAALLKLLSRAGLLLEELHAN